MLTLPVPTYTCRCRIVVPSARGNSLILEGMKRSYIYRCLEDETLCIKSDGKKCVAIEHGRLSSLPTSTFNILFEVGISTTGRGYLPSIMVGMLL